MRSALIVLGWIVAGVAVSGMVLLGRRRQALVGRLLRERDDLAGRNHALDQERDLRDAILYRLDDGVLLFAATGEVVYRNDRADRLVGPISHLRQVAPGDLRQAIEWAITHQARRTLEVERPESRIVAATAISVPDDRVLVVLRDVTEARAVDAVRRDFVANASHELKTPAASLRALAETIEAAATDDPTAVPHFAVQLEREAMRLSRIISDLLDLSRLEGEIGERDEVRLDRLVTAEVGRVAGSGKKAGLTVNVSAARPVMVTGSSRDLGLLVRNLVENALQYTRVGGRIEVDVRSEDGRAVLTIRDTGVGIPRKDQTRVFERFYRVDRARPRETGGTGLGLSIVKHVVENHGGTIDLKSRLGEGSTFTVRFPLRVASASMQDRRG